VKLRRFIREEETNLGSGSKIRKISIVGFCGPLVRSSTRFEVFESLNVERSGRRVERQGQGDDEPLRGRERMKWSGRAS